MNFCPSVRFIRLCRLTEARTYESFRETTKSLIKILEGINSFFYNPLVLKS